MPKHPSSTRVAQSSDVSKRGAPPRTRPAALLVGTVLLLIAAGAAILLSIEHLGGMSLPGCGEGGACAQALASKWAKVPGLNWPVAFLGAAYFTGMLITWLVTRGALPSALRWIARLGVLGSLGFGVIIVGERLFCPYCLASHIANLCFWITLELTQARTSRPTPALAGFAGGFVVASAVFAVWQGAIAQKIEDDRSGSVQQMISRSHAATQSTTKAAPLPPSATMQTATETQRNPTQPAPPSVASKPAPTPTTAAVQPANPSPATARAFTGRYRLGPEQAAIRIVLFTDFQCPDCRKIEDQIEQILKDPAKYPSVSVSMKHFPFNSGCNPYIKSNLHPNACWAARAAEAAGLLWGNDGFWKMHDWLFARRGVFEKSEEVTAAIQSWGYTAGDFFKIMQSPDTLKLVQQDCQEAADLGIYFTPMIFINGVELKGWSAPNALIRTVAEVAATNPPARSADFDQPPRALDKYVADWRDEPVRQLPPDAVARSTGPADAKLRIVVWGDYQETGTAETDQAIRRFMQGRTDVQYTFRHAPFNGDCNPAIPYRRHPLACWASRAAEAAGNLGGADAYWRMHAWLMDNFDASLRAAAGQLNVQPTALRDALHTMSEADRNANCAKLKVDPAAAVSAMQQHADAALATVAKDMGIESAALVAAMEDPAVMNAIRDDLTAGTKLPSLRYGAGPGLHGIPAVFINDKYVPRIALNGKNVLDVILQAAAEDLQK